MTNASPASGTTTRTSFGPSTTHAWYTDDANHPEYSYTRTPVRTFALWIICNACECNPDRRLVAVSRPRPLHQISHRHHLHLCTRPPHSSLGADDALLRACDTWAMLSRPLVGPPVSPLTQATYRGLRSSPMAMHSTDWLSDSSPDVRLLLVLTDSRQMRHGCPVDNAGAARPTDPWRPLLHVHLGPRQPEEPTASRPRRG